MRCDNPAECAPWLLTPQSDIKQGRLEVFLFILTGCGLYTKTWKHISANDNHNRRSRFAADNWWWTRSWFEGQPVTLKQCTGFPASSFQLTSRLLFTSCWDAKPYTTQKSNYQRKKRLFFFFFLMELETSSGIFQANFRAETWRDNGQIGEASCPKPHVWSVPLPSSLQPLFLHIKKLTVKQQNAKMTENERGLKMREEEGRDSDRKCLPSMSWYFVNG